MSGGGNNMPMASNKGQQMQNPHMGQQMGVGQGGMQPQAGMQTALDRFNQQGNMGQMPPHVGMFGGQPQTAYQMPNGPMMDQSALQRMQQAQQMQGGMQPAMGIGALGGQMPSAIQGGAVMDYDSPRFPPQGYMPENYDPSRGQQFLPRDQNGNPIYGAPGGQSPPGVVHEMNPYGQRPPGVVHEMNPFQQDPNKVDMRPTNMGPGMGMPRMGIPEAYRPTNGPIDGRQLRDQMDITKRRPMGGPMGMMNGFMDKYRDRDDRDQSRLPGAIGNDLPPSLKRPTQGNYKGYK